MLKKKLRLGRRELNSFFKAKTRLFAGKKAGLRYKKNNLGFSRFAFVPVLSKKLPKKGRAVLRNKARRRLSEAINQIKLPEGEGRDIVVFLRIDSKALPKMADLREDINDVLYKVCIPRSIL